MLQVFDTLESKPTLKQAQEIVGGIVEMVHSPSDPDIQVLVNEEGLLLNLPWNKEATRYAETGIVGNAIVLKCKAKWD